MRRALIAAFNRWRGVETVPTNLPQAPAAQPGSRRFTQREFEILLSRSDAFDLTGISA